MGACSSSMPEGAASPEHGRLAPRKTTQGQPLFNLKVLSAELNRSFDQFGKMDPFAVIQVVEPDGSIWEMARTATDWGAHMQPKWDHTCRGILYHGRDCNGRVRIQVFEKNFGDIRKATFCGEVTVAAESLVEEVEEVGGQWSEPKALTLVKNGDVTGTVTVQAGLNVDEPGGAGVACTLMDSRRFEEPVRPAPPEECQGTAPCFSLRLKSTEGALADRWVGKDANAGASEVPFYERRLALGSASACELRPLFEFMLEYGGVAECNVEGKKSGGQLKQVMVLQSLAAGSETLRVLDIKIGEQAMGGTKEKESVIGTIKRSIAEGLRLEAKEGFFLEGFVGQPAALRSRNPLIHTLYEGNGNLKQKAVRVMLQRMPASEMLMHFVDVHLKSPVSRLTAPPGSSLVPPVTRAPTGSTLATSSSTMTPVNIVPALPMDEITMAAWVSPTEMAELALGEAVRQLCRLALACRKVPVPQKWLRSSVALSFDSGCISRIHMKNGVVDDSNLHKIAKVKIHNWGNSELSTKEAHGALQPDERKERVAAWRCYKGGVDRLAWEAARAYHQRFGNASQWEEVVVQVFDFDSTTADDLIGSAILKLESVEEKSVQLIDGKGNAVVNKSGEATITYSMKYREFPAGARLRGAWCVTILRASNLTVCDKVLGTSDPYVTLSATSEDSSQRLVQNSAVVVRNLNPSWNECFEFPLALEGSSHLERLLCAAAPGMELDRVIVATDATEADENRALGLWKEHLTAVASGASSPSRVGGA